MAENRFVCIDLKKLYNLDGAATSEDIGQGRLDGQFALAVQRGESVRLARSLQVPMRYFIVKQSDGPALVVAHRIDAIKTWLGERGLGDQFHSSYTRMVPAHHLTEIQLVGCPDPNPTYRRFFAPARESQPNDLTEIGRRYIGALANEMRKWLATLPETG